VDQISDTSERGLLKIVELLKSAYGLKVGVKVHLSSEPFLLGKTFKDEDGYHILVSEPDPYLLLHEFYHILTEERVMKRHIGSRCGFCTKIVEEMQNALTDLAIERIISKTEPNLFPSYFPKIKNNLDQMGRCGVLSFDPTRTVAYNLYLETAIGEMYPDLREDYNFWDRITLSDSLQEGVEDALDIAGRFVREGQLSWRELVNATVDLSWSIFEADVMFIESRSEYRIMCITGHHRSEQAVSDMISCLKRLSQEWNRS